jgi:hypothetical protein
MRSADRGRSNAIHSLIQDTSPLLIRFTAARRQARAAPSVKAIMSLHDLVVLCGLALAAWGHLLLGERRLAVAVWRRLDDLFPAAVRSSAPVAGVGLLAMGGFCVIAGIGGG